MFVKKNFLSNSSGMGLISTLIALSILAGVIFASTSFYEIIVKLYRKANILRAIDKKSEHIFKYLADYPLCKANFQGQSMLNASSDKTQMINNTQLKSIDGSIIEDFSVPFEYGIKISSIYLNDFQHAITYPGNEVGTARLNIEYSYTMNTINYNKQISKLIFVEKFNDLINVCGSNLDFNSHWMWNQSLSDSIYYPGKIGINTATPAYSLDVVGNSVLNVTGGYALDDGGVRFLSTGSQFRIDSTEGGNFMFLTYASSGKRLFVNFAQKFRWSHYAGGGPGQYQGYYDGGASLMMTLANTSNEFWKFYVFRNTGPISGVNQNGLRIVGENPNSIFRIRSNVNLFDSSGGGGRFFVSGTAGGPSSWNSLSDKNQKKDIIKIHNIEEKFREMNEYQFKFKNDTSGKSQLGFIAQEVQKVLPEVVDETGEYLKVDYGSVNGLLIEKIKNVHHEHSSTKEKFKTLKAHFCRKYQGLKSCQTRQ